MHIDVNNAFILGAVDLLKQGFKYDIVIVMRLLVGMKKKDMVLF